MAGLAMYGAAWIQSPGSVQVGLSTYQEALGLCQANHSQRLPAALQVQLVNKLLGDVFRLVTEASNGELDTAKASVRVSRAFQSRELGACLMKKYRNDDKNPPPGGGGQHGADAGAAAGALSILVLLHAAADATLVTAMLQGGFAAGQAHHLMASFFNEYMFSAINFVTTLLHSDGAQALARLTADRHQAAASAAALAPMSYDNYRLLVTYDSLHGSLAMWLCCCSRGDDVRLCAHNPRRHACILRSIA